MMNITPRVRQILLTMLKEDRMMSVQELADAVGLSRRTVQRELEGIDSSLKGMDVVFMSKKGSGIWLEGREEEKEKLETALLQNNDFDAGNRNERKKRLIFELLKEKNISKLSYYSSKFKVSESTVSGDLKEVQRWLAQFGLRIERKAEGGLGIEGEEADYRRAVRAFLDENLEDSFLRDAYEERLSDDQKILPGGPGRILNEDILKRIIRRISEMEGGQLQNLTQSSYTGLILHLTIAVQRILKQDVLRENMKWDIDLMDSAEYGTAKKIAGMLEKEFGIEMPDVEISYICLHLKAAKHGKIEWGSNRLRETDPIGFPQMVNEMIEAFDRENAYWLKQDDEFLQGLLAHLQPTMVRILYHKQIVNPVLDSVKTEYAEIFQKCVCVAQVMEKRLGQEIPEAEIGFLAIHFGAAMERLENARETYRVVNIGVVCASGIGISRLMSTKLSREFRDRVKLKVYGSQDITPYIASKTDFFVASVSMEPQGTPTIFVNPLLSETDMKQIREFVRRFEHSPKKEMEGEKENGRMERAHSTVEQVRLFVEHTVCFRVKNSVTLEELLTEIGKTLSPYREFSEMIREDLYRREQIASQIFSEFGFGLFHTRTNGTMWPIFAVCLPKEEGVFSDSYMKGVGVIFVMLIPEDDSIDVNSELLGQISNLLLDDPDFMKTALAGEESEMKEYLSACLKRYFMENFL